MNNSSYAQEAAKQAAEGVSSSNLCATITCGSNRLETTVKRELVLSVLDRYFDNPQTCSKDQAAIMYPADCEVRKERDDSTRYGFLWLDVDSGNHRIDDVQEALKLVAPGYLGYIYASKSSEVANKKWRIITPLAVGVNEYTFVRSQKRLAKLFAKHDIITDACTTRSGQGLYLPNVGSHYQSTMVNGRLLLVNNVSKPITPTKANPSIDRVLKPRKHNATYTEIVGYFNQTYPIATLLADYGYQKRGDQYSHPNSSTGTYSGKVFGNNCYFALGTNDVLYNDGGAVNSYIAASRLMGKREAFKLAVRVYRS